MSVGLRQNRGSAQTVLLEQGFRRAELLIRRLLFSVKPDAGLFSPHDTNETQKLRRIETR
jgi:hypothetical protein